MRQSIESLRRAAKALRASFNAGDSNAVARVQAHRPGLAALRHADALHVIARESGFDSWPKLKFTLEAQALDRAGAARRLADALFHGRGWVIDALLAQMPDLGRETMALACATYDVDEARRRIAADPGAATRAVDGRSPIVHLAFSRHHLCGGDPARMLDLAEALLAAGADVNDGFPAEPGGAHRLSALYGAIGHGNNMALGAWLLAHGADPNDQESLYHATELGHGRGVRLLLEHGARTEGTNALLRALDFDDAETVGLLLAAGADPNEGVAAHPSGQPPTVIPALHQAARRMCSAPVARLLMDHGARIDAIWGGHSAYALARIYGNGAVARVLAEAGAPTALTPVESQLARAADGDALPDDWIDMSQLSDESRLLLCRLVACNGADAHIQRLLDMGFDANIPDEMGLTPLHLAGWEGLAQRVRQLLRAHPDLGHVNGYGGTFFSTILHGAENCPHRAQRDHIGCMELALTQGLAIPRKSLDVAAPAEMAAFLTDWAARHPGQVVEDGVF